MSGCCFHVHNVHRQLAELGNRKVKLFLRHEFQRCKYQSILDVSILSVLFGMVFEWRSFPCS